jgi:tight adherence protein B
MDPWAAACAAAAVLVLMADARDARMRRLLVGTRAPSNVLHDPWRLLRRTLRRGEFSAFAARRAVVDLADGWASQVASGRPPVPSLVEVMGDGPEFLADRAENVRLGADPLDVLASAARSRGADGLLALRACWLVSRHAGAGLAGPARRVAAALRDDLAIRAELQAQTAAPRATARLVALLPLMGPALGVLVGADTVGVLLGSPIGRACLVMGLTLDALGLWWVGRIIASASP